MLGRHLGDDRRHRHRAKARLGLRRAQHDTPVLHPEELPIDANCLRSKPIRLTVTPEVLTLAKAGAGGEEDDGAELLGHRGRRSSSRSGVGTSETCSS